MRKAQRLARHPTSAYPLDMSNDAALTRRRGDNPHEETWQIDFTDVRIGTIGVRAGVPVQADQWGWSVGFILAWSQARAEGA